MYSLFYRNLYLHISNQGCHVWSLWTVESTWLASSCGHYLLAIKQACCQVVNIWGNAIKPHVSLLLTLPCCPACRISPLRQFFVSIYCLFAFPVGHISIFLSRFFRCQYAWQYKLCAEPESEVVSHSFTVLVMLPCRVPALLLGWCHGYKCSLWTVYYIPNMVKQHCWYRCMLNVVISEGSTVVQVCFTSWQL